MGRLTTTLLIGAVLATVLLVPTASVSVSDGEVDRTDELAIEPGPGPNAEYAVIEDGELAVELEGLNQEARTDIDEVIRVTLEEETARELWVSHDIAGVSFYPGEERTRELDSDEPVRLEPGDSASIGLQVDTAEAPAGTQPFAIVTTVPRSVELTNVTVVPTDLEVGENVTATGTLENTGAETETVPVSLVIDGIEVDERTVTVDPDSSESVTFEHEMGESGTYNITLNDHEPTTVTVAQPVIGLPPADEDPDDPPEPLFERSEMTMDRTTVSVGESVSVQATVLNNGTAPGEGIMELAVDRVLVDSEAFSLEPGESRTIVFEHTFGEVGTYDITIDGEQIGTVTVEPATDRHEPVRDLAPVIFAAVLPPLVLCFLYLAVVLTDRTPRRTLT